MTSGNHPLVTIGMPVYNGGEALKGVLESIVSQTFEGFNLVISDNASSDATESICREFLRRDNRVTYIRQSSNIGAEANFDFVLSKADTEYFMWAAADDIRSNEFLSRNVEFLELNPDFLASTCPVRFEDGEFNPILMGDATRDETDPVERILKFLESWHANGRMYSLFRTRALKGSSLTACRYLGGDWTLVMNLLAKGKFKRIDSGFVVLGRKGFSNSLDIFSKYRKGLMYWVFPLPDLTHAARALLGNATARQKLNLSLLLFRLNMNAFRCQIEIALKKSLGKDRSRNSAAAL